MCFCRLSPTKEAAGATAGKRNELAADLIPEVVSELLVEGIQGMRCGNAAGEQSCCYAVEESVRAARLDCEPCEGRASN